LTTTGASTSFYQGESLNYYASNDIVLGDCAGGYKSDQLDTTLGTHNPAAIFAAWRSSLWTDFENDEHLELIRFFWSAPMEFLTQDPSYRLVSTGIDFISDYAVAADCDVDGDGFRDLFVAPFSHPTLVYRNMYPTSGNLSFVGFPLNGGLTFMEFASLVCVRSTDGLRDDVLVGHSSGVNFYISNGSLLEGMSSTEAFGRDFSTNRFYVAAAKCQSDITCVALIADRAYSPTLNHSLFYIRLSNGSFAYEQSVSEHALPYNADKASVRFADFDGDGNLDIVYIGVMDEFGGGDGIVFSQNYGNGSWKHLPLADVAPLTYGFSDGLIAVGQLSSALDNFTDILVTGFSDNCGVKILVRSIPAPNITTSSNSSGSTSTSAIDFVEEGSSASADIGAVLGGALGGFSFLLLFCFCCICFAALLCISCTALAVIVVAAMAVIIAVVAVAGTGLFGSLEIAAVAAVVKRRRRRSHGDDQFNWDAMMDQIEAFAAKAASVDDYVTIDWGEFRIVRKLGAGAFGEVLLAEWNDVEVALKMFRNPNDEALSEFQHEALMMSKVSHHPNIVQLIGVSFSDSSMALVLGLCKGGSLLSALQSGRLGPADKHRVAVEVCGALAFLHSLGIVHRDIAARNVLLDGSGCSKLADLGLSRVLEDKYGEQQTASTIGPVRWMAPEAISARQYSSASDAYSFGVLLWELWTNGALPYQSMASVGDVALHVIRDNMRPEIDDELVPASHAHVMRALWDTDPALRPTTLDVLRLLRESDNPTPDIRDDMRSARSGTAVSSASSVVSSQYVDASGVISA
jgi:tRNA A-37 threonylcarbamoyl transferase component Bud32